LIKPTVATPTVQMPTSQGFGFAAVNSGQAPAAQTVFPQLTPRTFPGAVTLGVPQGTGQSTQPTGQIQSPQSVTIVQPASQPLPPPTPLTTTVSSPQAPYLQ
jgi:hypothetical protein